MTQRWVITLPSGRKAWLRADLTWEAQGEEIDGGALQRYLTRLTERVLEEGSPGNPASIVYGTARAALDAMGRGPSSQRQPDGNDPQRTY